MHHAHLSILLALSTWAAAPSDPGAPARKDIVLILADDIGVDRVGVFGEGAGPSFTPNLDRLGRNGVVFTEAWANPNCSPTRAMVQSGKYSLRTGVGRPLLPSSGPKAPSLELSETTIAEGIAAEYTSYAIGKWHLARRNLLPTHPLDQGYSAFSGTHFNLNSGEQSYENYRWYENSTETMCHENATVKATDAAIRFGAEDDGPVFVYLAYHAAHSPYLAPPSHLHHFDLEGLDPNDPVHGPLFQRAMVEAMDTEIGRLMEAFPGALFIFAGDNGNSERAVDDPGLADRVKGSLYQGGIRVPLIVCELGEDPEIVTHPGRRIAHPVSLADLFATVLEATGEASSAPDSVSLVPYLQGDDAPLREFVYAERFGRRALKGGSAPRYTHHRRAIRDARYKLIRGEEWADEMYDLLRDPDETQNLLDDGVPPFWLVDAYRRLGYAIEHP